MNLYQGALYDGISFLTNHSKQKPQLRGAGVLLAFFSSTENGGGIIPTLTVFYVFVHNV